MTRARAAQVLRVLSVAWLLFMLEPLSDPGLGFPWFVVVEAVSLVIAFLTLLSALASAPRRRWLFALGITHLAAVAALFGLFVDTQSALNPVFRLRFHLSRPALDAAVHAARSGREPGTPAWVGLFHVERIEVFEPEVRLISGGCGIVDECGLMHRPDPLPPGRAETRAQPLGGPGYHLYAVF